MTFRFDNFDDSEPITPSEQKFMGWLIQGEDGIYRPERKIDHQTSSILSRIIKILQLGK